MRHREVPDEGRKLETDWITVEFHPLRDAETSWVAPTLDFAVVNSDMSPVSQARVADALITFAKALAGDNRRSR